MPHLMVYYSEAIERDNRKMIERNTRKSLRLHNSTALNSNGIERHALVAIHVRQIGDLFQALNHVAHDHIPSIYDQRGATRRPR